MKQLLISGITAELERKKIKNMYLRLLPPDGRVHISAPLRMSEESIRNFVLSRLDWIEKHQEIIRQKKEYLKLDYVTGEEVTVWGRRLTLTVLEGSPKNAAEIKDTQLRLYLKNISQSEQRLKIVNAFYRNEMVQAVPPLIMKWEKIIGVKSSGFTIRDMKTRWGTCNIRSANICLNLQLAKKPERCLEYVIVHELVHLLEHSHNRIFKGYMDRFLPDWRNIKNELNGSNL